MKQSFRIQLYILVTFIITLMARKGNEYSMVDIIICLMTIIFSLIVYFYGQQKSEYKGHWARPSNVLLVGLLIVNYQLIIDLVLGLRSFFDFAEPSVTNRTCYISTLGVLSTIVGLCVPEQISKQPTKQSNYGQINMSFLVFMQVVLFVIWFSTVNIRDLLSGEQYGVVERAYWEQFYNNSITVVLACVCLNSRDGSVKNIYQFLKKNKMISWVCIGLYMLFRLVSGDRGPFLYTGLLIFYSYIYCTKLRIKLLPIIILLILGAISMTIIGLARIDASSGSFSQRVAQSSSELDFSERYNTKTVFSPTLELARSYRCNQYAVSDIEESGVSLHYGTYQLFQIIGIFPFALSFITETYNIPEWLRGSGYYFTLREKGDYYLYGQVGTTCIADLFMDFGAIGVFLGMLILGLVFSKVDKTICIDRNISPLGILLVLSFASVSIYIGRATIISQIKPILVMLVMFYINSLFQPSNSRR